MTKVSNSPKQIRTKYLTFKLSGEIYGVEIKHVREIVAMLPVTLVPNAPKFIKGVVNLRGKIIPLMDMRIKFNMPCAPATFETCIVVMELKLNQTNVVAGILVDGVCEVADIDASAIGSIPEFGARIDTSFLIGVARIGNDANLLLDIEKALSFEEKSSVESAATVNEPASALSESKV